MSLRVLGRRDGSGGACHIRQVVSGIEEEVADIRFLDDVAFP